jgi:hypothetical protein
MTFKEKIVDWMIHIREYFIKLGLVGSILLILWWIIKIIICATIGVCIIV